MWNDTLANLATYEGGTAGTATTATGPFWEEVPEMRGFTPIGVGKVGDATDGTDLALNATIGAESGSMMPNHRHGIGVMHDQKNDDSTWPSGAATYDAGAMRIQAAVNLTDESYSGIVYDAAYKNVFQTPATNLKSCNFLTTNPLELAEADKKTSKMQPSRAVYFIRRTVRRYYAV
jgi:hypothetical protein